MLSYQQRDGILFSYSSILFFVLSGFEKITDTSNDKINIVTNPIKMYVIIISVVFTPHIPVRSIPTTPLLYSFVTHPRTRSMCLTVSLGMRMGEWIRLPSAYVLSFEL